MRTTFLIGLSLACLCLTAGVVAASPFTDSAEGVTIEVGEEVENELVDHVESVASTLGIEVKSNAAVAFIDGNEWIVLHDEPIHTGESQLEGDAYAASNVPGLERGIFVADDIETSTDGEPTSIESIGDDPSQYHGELVNIESKYQQITYTAGAVDEQLTRQETAGSFAGGDIDVLPPGQAARWTALNVSSEDHGESPSEELNTRLGGSTNVVVQDSTDTRFWMDADVEMDAVVVDTGGTAVLYPAEITPNTQETDIESIQQGEHNGEAVQIEADLAEARVSVRETLISVARCAPDSVANPVTGCAPVLVDSVVHVGALYDGAVDGPEDILPMAGASNEIQSTIVDVDHRRVSVHGEVVSLRDIDPQLDDEQALIVYDIEGVNSNQNSPPPEAAEQRDVMSENMQRQMNATSAEDYSGEASRDLEESDGTGEDTDASEESVNEESDPSFEVSNVDIPDTHSGDEITATVTVENTGGASGEYDVVVEASASGFNYGQLKTVEVGVGESATEEITVEAPDEQDAEISVNDVEYGVVEYGTTLTMMTDSVAVLLPGVALLSLVGGVVLTPSGLLLAGLISVKQYREGSVEINETWWKYLTYTGVVLLIFGSFIYEIDLILFLAIVAGLAIILVELLFLAYRQL